MATTVPAIRPRRRRQRRACTRKNAYTGFSSRVQYGATLYAGYFGKKLGMDSLGLGSEDACAGCCLLYLLFQYTPDPGKTLPDTASNEDLRKRWESDSNAASKDSNEDRKVIKRSLGHVGLGGSALGTLMDKVRELEGCEKGVAVIVYGHGEPGKGIIFPWKATEEEKGKVGAGDLPEFGRGQIGILPGKPLLPGPGERPAPGIPGSRKWEDIWKNTKAMHVKACYSASSGSQFPGMYFTGYTGLFEFTKGEGKGETSLIPERRREKKEQNQWWNR